MTDSKFSLPHSHRSAHRRADDRRTCQSEPMTRPQAARHSKIFDDGTQSEDGEDRILKIPETAEYMCISRRQLHELSKSGALPRIKIGKSVRYSLADIRVFLESRKNGRGR